MHEIRFRGREPDAPALRVRVEDGTTLLAAATEAGLPVARACGEQLVCGRCGMRVLEGAAALSAEDPIEQRAKQRNRIPMEQRLACASRVHGNVTVTTPYW